MKDAKPPVRHIIPFAEALKLKSLRHLAGAAYTPKRRSLYRTWLPYGGTIGEASGTGQPMSQS